MQNKTNWGSVVSTETCHHIIVPYLFVPSVTNVVMDCCTLIISHKAKLTSSELRVLEHQRQFVVHELILTSALFLKTQPYKEVLATAIVHVQNTFRQYVPCRALPFSASGTCHRKTCLKVKKIKESHILGINEVNMARQVVSPHIKSSFNDWNTTANCVVLSKITVRTPATG